MQGEPIDEGKFFCESAQLIAEDAPRYHERHLCRTYGKVFTLDAQLTDALVCRVQDAEVRVAVGIQAPNIISRDGRRHRIPHNSFLHLCRHGWIEEALPFKFSNQSVNCRGNLLGHFGAASSNAVSALARFCWCGGCAGCCTMASKLDRTAWSFVCTPKFLSKSVRNCSVDANVCTFIFQL